MIDQLCCCFSQRRAIKSKLQHIKKYILTDFEWENDCIVYGWFQNDVYYIILDEYATVYTVLAELYDRPEYPSNFVFIRTDVKDCIPSIILNAVDLCDCDRESNTIHIVNVAQSPNTLLNLENCKMRLDYGVEDYVKNLFNVTYISV